VRCCCSMRHTYHTAANTQRPCNVETAAAMRYIIFCAKHRLHPGAGLPLPLLVVRLIMRLILLLFPSLTQLLLLLLLAGCAVPSSISQRRAAAAAGPVPEPLGASSRSWPC
jgi:hypothetical protein